MVRRIPHWWLPVLVMTGLARAADEEHGGGGSSPFAGDFGTALWTLVIFGLVLFVLGRFVWPQILLALKKREEFIFESLSKAKADREAAEARLKEYDTKLQAARDEATAIVEEGRRDAEVLRQKIDEQARADADASRERALRDIALAKDTAVKELYSLSATLATDVAGRIIKKELDAAGHEQLVAEAIKSLGVMETQGA